MHRFIVFSSFLVITSKFPKNVREIEASNIRCKQTLTIFFSDGQFFNGIAFQLKGCFKDSESNRDLPYLSKNPKASQDVNSCVEECTKKYFMFAGLQNAQSCFCGNSHGRYGPAKCRKRCANNDQEVCGDLLANSIYQTDVKVPGPPTNLKLKKATETQLVITWQPPAFAQENFVINYFIKVSVNDSFDSTRVNSNTRGPKLIQVSAGSKMTTIIGLDASTKYYVSLSAASKDGQGQAVNETFWTEIARPETPEAPKLVHHGHHDHHEDFNGEIHVSLKGLRRNRYGPISKYQVLVIDETNPAPFHDDQVYGYVKAMEVGLNYWIAAEFKEDLFGRDSEFVEFVVGDNRTYGTYLNYGPLPAGRDFHVTLGVVSIWQGVTKVSYAPVSHDQHAMENIAVFKFHNHDHDHDHDHDQDHDEKDHDHNGKKMSEGDQTLSLGLSVAIGVMSIVFISILAFYGYLRYTSYMRRSSGSRGDVQELTTHISSIDTEAGAVSNFAFDNDSVDDGFNSQSRMDNIRAQIWNIPRNFLELTHEVIGRGKFGSLVKGKVNKRGHIENVNIQVVPGKILEESEFKTLSKDLECVIRYGFHPNLIQLIGLCEDKDTIFVVFEQAWPTLKQALIDSRSLEHYPDYAEANGKFSTLQEEILINIMLGISRGMEHLASLGIAHKKLCARNIFLAVDQPKIGSIGIVDYFQSGQEPDMTRWTAQEAFKSNNYVWKCDVWSLGVVFWECLTLGATPFIEIPTKEVPMRVMRGMRLHQPSYVSEELFELLLECWQVDLDERPTFEEIVHWFTGMVQGGHVPVHFNLYSGFVYEPYSSDLELMH